VRWAGHVIGRGEKKRYMQGFMGKPDRKGTTGRPRR